MVSVNNVGVENTQATIPSKNVKKTSHKLRSAFIGTTGLFVGAGVGLKSALNSDTITNSLSDDVENVNKDFKVFKETIHIENLKNAELPQKLKDSINKFLKANFEGDPMSQVKGFSDIMTNNEVLTKNKVFNSEDFEKLTTSLLEKSKNLFKDFAQKASKKIGIGSAVGLGVACVINHVLNKPKKEIDKKYLQV